ncbi:hypothetical protein GOODEAATRI_031889 [Goodea atripinnis]|uniref:Uncharacterized protein n=1 Tax=Goodea atripinnis TaxID=208336 RepID=A0ABV0NFF2_9TELE
MTSRNIHLNSAYPERPLGRPLELFFVLVALWLDLYIHWSILQYLYLPIVIIPHRFLLENYSGHYPVFSLSMGSVFPCSCYPPAHVLHLPVLGLNHWNASET